MAAKDSTCAASTEVKVCDICGAVGFNELLAVCTECSERSEHVYCIQALCDSVPPNWICEGCKRISGENKDQIGRESSPPLLKMNLNAPHIKTLSPLKEINSHNEQCTFGQERGVKEPPPLKSVLSMVSCVRKSAGVVLQASAGDARVCSGTVGCGIAPLQDQVALERFHRGSKGLPSSKLSSCANPSLSKSKLFDSDQLPSFSMPSRPKSLLRSNSQSTQVSSARANKKADQPSEDVKVSEVAYNEHSRREISVSKSGHAPVGNEKKANQPSEDVKVSEVAYNEGSTREISVSKSGHAPVGNEMSCQQGGSIPCRNFSDQSKRVTAVEAGSNYGNLSRSSHVAIQRGSESKNYAESQKDTFCKEAHKVKQHTREEEASHGKAGLSGSKLVAPQMREPLEMVHAGTVPQPIFFSGAPVYSTPRPPVPRGGFHPLPVVDNERRWQPYHFHPPQGRPHELQGLMQHTIPQSTNYACASNRSYGDYVPAAVPEVQKLWRGCFNVFSSTNCSTLYNGIQAHPSSKADPKVWEAAQTLPGLLKLKELKRGLDNSTWPQRFLETPPTADNIGMFFFPKDMESHDSWYKPLADRLSAYDLILRTESASLYLLIFHSQLLSEADRLWDGRHYLWGVFRTKKSGSIQRASMLQSALNANYPTSSNDNGEVVDMEVDMVGGADILHSLPPLPPGSPPAKPSPPPTPPHPPHEDADVSLLGKGLPLAPPSPPPTPPQCQQAFVLESSFDLSAVPKHVSVLQEGASSTNYFLEGLPGGGRKRPRVSPTL